VKHLFYSSYLWKGRQAVPEMKHFPWTLTDGYSRYLTDTEVVETHEEEENEDPKSGFSNWEPLQGRCRALHPFSEATRGAKK
jgi:hypothetical protein